MEGVQSHLRIGGAGDPDLCPFRYPRLGNTWNPGYIRTRLVIISERRALAQQLAGTTCDHGDDEVAVALMTRIRYLGKATGTALSGDEAEHAVCGQRGSVIVLEGRCAVIFSCAGSDCA